MFGFLALIFGFYLLFTGSVPVGKFPFAFRSIAETSSILIRVSGLLIIAGLLIPEEFLAGWYGEPVILSAGLLVLFIGMIASLSGRAR